MQTVHHLVRSAHSVTDEDIAAVIRAGILACPIAERANWVKQLELSLDGYGGALSQRADRVRAVLIGLEADLRCDKAHHA